VAQSKVVVARTGYSTLMDLAVWKKPCLLIPTPGQPEQEYLGEYIKSQGWASVISQKEISVKTQIEEAKPFAFENYQEFRLTD
jgi:UDP-N-acetylglucosamine:LPS N-acetylglucosamine transferase